LTIAAEEGDLSWRNFFASTIAMKALLAALTFAIVIISAGAADHPAIGFERKQLSDQFFSEGASFGDIDGDGRNDLVSGPFWYAGPGFDRRHEIYPPAAFDPATYSDNFFSFIHDFNGDGNLDILVLGFPGKEAVWFENPGSVIESAEKHWPRHVVFDVVDNESPTFADLTGDGKPEIICSTGGVFGYVTPDWGEPEKAWTFHPISPPEVAGGRFTHGMGIGDVNGDGRTDFLEKTSWWQQPESLEGDPLWRRHRFEFSSPGGSQMYAYDFDGDGDNDIITSLAAHGWGLAWYEQMVDDDGKRGFQKHVIMGETPDENSRGLAFSQLHALALEDVDGDGIKDVITGKRWWAHRGRDPGATGAAVLYWFRTVRDEAVDGGVDFVPHLIDDDSGVGTDVVTGDIDGDGQADVLVGNKKGSFVYLQRRGEALENSRVVRPSVPVRRAPRRKAFVENGQSPGDALKGFSLYEGFQAKLIAAEPDITQPIAMTFDARGRLWVAEAHTYPVRAAEGEGRDRIVIFEDADHDGSYESRKIFAENLNLVSGLELGFGGVWVGAAPYLLFIPDKDRDDVPDGEPEVLLDGFGYQDTHETLNAFTWGPDGWLYGCHGVFTHSKVGAPGTADDERVPLNCGVWRFHPTRKIFEVFAHGTSNPWGVDFDDRGQAFISACVIPHLYHMVQGGRFQRQGGEHFNKYVYDDIKTIADHSHFVGSIREHAHWGKRPDAPTDTLSAGGGHAHCGLAVYLGDNFPDQFRGALLFNNLHGHGMNHDVATPRGSGFVGQHRPDFLMSNDRWHMGVATRVGPDGALYLSDWYDQQICHRKEPEIWDRDNGRIYRISYGDPEPKAIDLASLSDAQLVDLQLHRNDWQVRMSRRLLQERAAGESFDGSATERGLWKILNESTDETRQLRALWALHVIDGLSAKDHLGLLKNASPYVRAWTLQLIGETAVDKSLPLEISRRVSAMAKDDASPVVRLYLAALMQRVTIETRREVLAALAGHGEDATDHNLPLMIWYALEPLVAESPPQALEIADRTAIPLIAQHIYRRLAEDEAGRVSLLTQISNLGDQPQKQSAIVVAIGNALQARVKAPMPESWHSAFESLAGINDPEIRQVIENLAMKFGDRRILPSLREIAVDVKQTMERRRSAIDTLAAAKDKDAVPYFYAIARGANPPMRGHAIRALANFTDERTPKVLLTLFHRLEAEERRIVVEVLASNRDYALALLDAVGDGLVARDQIGAVEVRQLLALDDSGVTAALEKKWGVFKETSGEKRALLKRYRSLFTKDYLAKADLSNGRRLFGQSCFACHTLFGEGQKLGPDITGSNRMNLDYLLENILDPNALVGRDYQLTVLTLNDGRVLSGMLREANEDAVTVVMVGGVQQVVSRSEIASREVLEVSMMPEGLLAALSDEDARDLIAYLQSPQQVRMADGSEKVLAGESLKVVSAGSGLARAQGMAGFPEAKWEGDAHLWWTGARPGERLVLNFEIPTDGRWALYAVMTKARDYGRFKLMLDDGTPLMDEIDLYNFPDVVTTGEVSLGEHVMKAGRHQLVVAVTGAHPQAVKGYMFGLDSLRLTKRAE